MGRLQLLADRIRSLPVSARAAIAVVSAQRLMIDHLSLPVAERDSHIVSLAPDLDSLWQALLASSSRTDVALRKLLKKRKSEPYANETGKNGWPRGDDHAFAAAINALEAYCLQDARFGVGAAMRLIDNAGDKAAAISEELGEDLMSHKAKLRRQATERPEITRVTLGVGLMEREGVTASALNKLQRLFASGEVGHPRVRKK